MFPSRKGEFYETQIDYRRFPKDSVVAYKKVSLDAKVKDLIGGTNKVAIIVPGDSVKSVSIEESKEDGYGKQ